MTLGKAGDDISTLNRQFGHQWDTIVFELPDVSLVADFCRLTKAEWLEVFEEPLFGVTTTKAGAQGQSSLQVSLNGQHRIEGYDIEISGVADALVCP